MCNVYSIQNIVKILLRYNPRNFSMYNVHVHST